MPRRVALALIAALCALACGAVPAQAEQARPADAFADSVGVNVHSTYGDTAYGNWSRVISDLQWLGVRHVRDGLKSYPEPQARDYNTWEYNRFNQLAANGIRSTLIMAWPDSDQGSLPTLLSVVRNRLPGAVEALEGPNEYDNRGVPGWPAKLRAYQQQLNTLAKADPATAHLPVVGPSFVSWQSRRAVGDLGAFTDVGNMHPYPGGRMPDGPWLTDEITQARWMKPTGPLWATETGYHDAVNQRGGHPPTSDAAQTVYIPQLLLDYFARGISRTFLYELLDEKPNGAANQQEQHFGLFRNDNTPKPAATALRGLVSLTADPGPSFRAGSLDYQLPGGDAALRHLLLQKRDGTFLLILWRATSVWDQNARRDLAPVSAPVTVDLAAARPMRAFMPARPDVAIAHSASTSRFTLAVGDAPVVVSLGPAAHKAPARPTVIIAPVAHKAVSRATVQVRCGRPANCSGTLRLRVHIGRAWASTHKVRLRAKAGHRRKLRVRLPRRARHRRRLMAYARVSLHGRRGVVMRRVKLR